VTAAMTSTIQTLLLLLAVLVVVAIIARRFNIAPAILLVVAGVMIAVTPGLPRVDLAPELVLFGILPPLVYLAGVQMSWREFRFDLRAITLLALGCVVFTTCAVAVTAHWLLGMPIAVGFVLGAILGPTDPVAPASILRQLGVPRRLIVILEAEGLANDATALILYRFAIAAVGTGVFSLGEAVGTFVIIVVGEIAFGIGIGWLSLRLRRWARDPRVEITLSLLTPYLAFLVPAHLGGSGVLATMTAGLFASWNGPLLIPAATRVQGIFFWDLIVYLLDGIVFLVTGLQIRTLLDRTSMVGLQESTLAVLLAVVVVIAARFVWMYPAAYIPRWLSPSLRRRDPVPSWKRLFILAFVGVRGVVSLAAALAIPLTTQSGTLFPYRDLILFVAFGVIIVTLVVQGLLLPSLVRGLGLASHAAAEHESEHKAELIARAEALQAAQSRLEQLAAEEDISPEVLAFFRMRHDYRAAQVSDPTSNDLDLTLAAAELRSKLIAVEREYIYRLLQSGQITDEVRRRIERELDLEEVSIGNPSL
jgi:CPA1 family monovalent cation:H+ antiporter